MVRADDVPEGWVVPRRKLITTTTIEQAITREEALSATEHHAVDVWFDARRGAVAIMLTDGRLFGARRELIPSLAGASISQLRTVRVSPDGAFLLLDSLDTQINVDGLVTRLMETSASTMRRAAARLAGRATSPAKAAAAAKNGRLGGRPRKGAAREVA